MAEATLTLDNSEQWLPIEFSEVAITYVDWGGESARLVIGTRQ